MTTHLSAGFSEDCRAFLERFTALNSISFHDFCTIWNNMNFHCIYYARWIEEDLNTFVEEALTIVKRVFVHSSSMEEKCCCLYLLYSIYQKQPDKFVAKIRVTESDWVVFKEFYNNLNSEEFQHPFIIWWKLFQDDAFHFCLYESNVLEGQSKSDKDKAEGVQAQLQFKPISDKILHELENLQANHGIMSALEALEIAYNEMKESLDQPSVSSQEDERGQTLAPSALVKDINESIVDINELFTHLKPNRSKRKSRRRKMSERSVRETDDEQIGEIGEGKQSIKDKRKSIKDRAFKEIKKKRGSVTDKRGDEAGCSSSKESPGNRKPKPMVDQKHFKKITEMQKIFEMNSLLQHDSETPETWTSSQASSSPSPKRKKSSSNK